MPDIDPTNSEWGQRSLAPSRPHCVDRSGRDRCERGVAARNPVPAPYSGNADGRWGKAIILLQTTHDRIPAKMESLAAHNILLVQQRFLTQEAKFASIDAQFVSLDARTEQDRNAAKEAVATALQAAKEAVSAAFQAAKDVIAAQNAASTSAILKVRPRRISASMKPSASRKPRPLPWMRGLRSWRKPQKIS